MSLLLAIEPGFAVPLFPAAGIALGVMMASLGRLWPGVWLGSFVLNVGIAWQRFPLTSFPTILLLATGIALAATAQAVFSYRLVTRFLKSPHTISTERDVALLVFCAIPLGSVITPLLGSLALTSASLLPINQFLSHAFSWWLGDSLGVVVFMPLTMMALCSHSDLWRRRRLSLGIPLLLSFALTAAFFVASFASLEVKGVFFWRSLLLYLLFTASLCAFLLSVTGHSSEIQEIARNLRELADFMPQIVCTTRSDGSWDFFNARYYEYTGSTLPIDQEDWGPYVHPEDLQFCIDTWSAAMQNPEPFEFQFRVLQRKSGAYRWQLTGAQPVFDKQGKLRKWLMTCTDVHEQRMLIQDLIHSQSVINESEDKFRFLADSVPNLVWMADKSGAITFFNQRWLDYTGFGAEAARGLYDDVLIHEDEREDMHRQWNEAIANKAAFDMEYRLRRHDGEYRWQLARALPYFNEAGEVEHWFGSCTDVHDQKLKSQELNRVQSALEMAQNATRVACWEIDTETSVIAHTSILEGLYGISEHVPHLHHGELLKVVHDEDRELVRSSFDDWVSLPASGDQESYRIEFRVVWPDASIHCLSLVAYAIRDDKGVVSHIRGAIFDVTTMRKMQAAQQQLSFREETARESSRLKSEFLAAMSHEIRTPINGVIGMTTFLLETDLTKEQYEYADAVRRSGNSLLTVINDILDFSKIEAGQLHYETIPFSLKNVVEDVRLISVPLVSGKALSCDFQIEASLPEILMGDPGRLRQILNNLISNAIKFTENGFVRLTVDAQSRMDEGGGETIMLIFKVADSGIGISEQSRQHLFQPFVQADSSTTRRYGGTGLGLSISKHLVESMKGTIGFESEEGSGSTFWFTAEFGLSDEQHTAPFHYSRSTPAERCGGRKRILVVEDVYLNQFIATKALESLGYSAHAVANGKEAIEALSESPYDLVLMDCLMPVMDGYEATACIRASTSVRNNRVPIVAMTACAMKGDIERCLNAGMNDYLSKPVHAETLEFVIERWLNREDLGIATKALATEAADE